MRCILQATVLPYRNWQVGNGQPGLRYGKKHNRGQRGRARCRIQTLCIAHILYVNQCHCVLTWRSANGGSAEGGQDSKRTHDGSLEEAYVMTGDLVGGLERREEEWGRWVGQARCWRRVNQTRLSELPKTHRCLPWCLSYNFMRRVTTWCSKYFIVEAASIVRRSGSSICVTREYEADDGRFLCGWRVSGTNPAPHVSC